VSKCSPATVAAWRRQWPGYQSPQHLYPSRTANADYVGIELIPIGAGLGGQPMAPGLRFTRAQHEAVVALGRWLASRHAWPVGWALSPRLVGHEDVQPIQRQDRGGGWDPGSLRERPYFDFEFVRAALS
jgi:N-acetyl-anhydromuramyl-L-alanine amidase AmpD